MNLTIQTRRTGNFVRGNGRLIVRRGIERSVKQLIEDGEGRLAEMLRPRPAGVFLSVAQAKPGQASTGHYRRNINSRQRGTTGVINDGGVVYGPWLERGRAGTRFRGYHSFRQVGQWLNRRAKGVLREQIRRVVRELNRPV